MIAVIDNIPIYRSGEASFLRDEFPNETIVDSESASALKSAYPTMRISVIIIAIEYLHGKSIVQTIYEVKKSYPLAKLIIKGNRVSDGEILNYLYTGIFGYVDKNAETSELTTCVKQVKNGKKYISQDLLWALLKLDKQKKVPSSPCEPILTKRQHLIATYLSDGKKTSWIANELKLAVSTISTVKMTVFTKLCVDNIIDLKEKLGLVTKSIA